METSVRASQKFKESLLELEKAAGYPHGRPKGSKDGTRSFVSGYRQSPIKDSVDRTGATSPEYNIYSDTDNSQNGQASPGTQKEGGGAEQSSSYGHSATGTASEAKSRQNGSENLLV